MKSALNFAKFTFSEVEETGAQSLIDGRKNRPSRSTGSGKGLDEYLIIRINTDRGGGQERFPGDFFRAQRSLA